MKQAPRAWYTRIDSYFREKGFKRCSYEYSLYIRADTHEDLLLVCLYVDDMIITGSDQQKIKEFKLDMVQTF